MKSLLIDIAPLSCGCSDQHLEMLHKSLSEGDDIWRKHESVFIRALVERVSDKGVETLEGLKKDLARWLSAKPVSVPVPRPGYIGRWTPNELSAVRAYLAGLPKELWAAGDYSLLVDYLVQSHLPADFALKWSEWGVRRAVLMGKVQSVAAALTEAEAERMLAYFAAEHSLAAVERLANVNRAVLDYGIAHCGESMAAFTDGVRHRLKRILLDHTMSQTLTGTVSGQSLESKLFDTFADFNRDWRRIALTEPGEMANQGFVSSVNSGEKLRRIEQYNGACAFCKKWNGRVLTVVAADAPEKDWDTEIWPGKTNYGRSASPYKRVGGALVKRSDDELWKPVSGLFHPHCRGTWVRTGERRSADEFTLWLDGFLAKVKEQKQDAAIA